MTQKFQHLALEQMDAWTQAAHERVQSELPAGYSGVEVIRERISDFRKEIAGIFSKFFKISVAFPHELGIVCSQVDEAIASLVDSMNRETEVPQELKDFTLALVRSERKKIQKFIEEGYDFTDMSRDLFMGATASVDRQTAASFLGGRAEAIVLAVCFEHFFELKIAQYINWNGSNKMVIDVPVNVDKDTAKKVNRSNQATNCLYEICDDIVRFLRISQDQKAPVSFEQFRNAILYYLEQGKIRVGEDSKLSPKAKDYFFERFRKIEAIFGSISQSDFMSYKPSQPYRNVEIRKFVSHIFEMFESDYHALAERYRPVKKQASLEPPSAVIAEQPVIEVAFSSSSSDVPVLDDIETTVDTLPPVEDSELQQRISNVLGWIDTLPKAQRHSYVRNEIRALKQVLEDQGCYDPKLVLFALLRMESFVSSTEIILNGTAMSTKPDQAKIVSTYRDVFQELENSRHGSDRGVPVLIDEALHELQQGADSIRVQRDLHVQETQAKCEEFHRTMEDLQGQLRPLVDSHDSAEKELGELKRQSAAALENDDFDTLRSLSTRSAELKARVKSLHEQWQQMEGRVAVLRSESEERLVVSAREQRAFEDAMVSCEARQVSLEKSLAALVDQSRSQDNLPDDSLPSTVLS